MLGWPILRNILAKKSDKSNIKWEERKMGAERARGGGVVVATAHCTLNDIEEIQSCISIFIQ